MHAIDTVQRLTATEPSRSRRIRLVVEDERATWCRTDGDRERIGIRHDLHITRGARIGNDHAVDECGLRTIQIPDMDRIASAAVSQTPR